MQSIIDLQNKTVQRIQNGEKLPHDGMQYIAKFVQYGNEQSQEIINELNKTSLSQDEKKLKLFEKVEELVPYISKAIDVVFSLGKIEDGSASNQEKFSDDISILIQDLENLKVKQKQELSDLITSNV